MKSNKVPGKLKVWFIVHFALDISFAIPLLLVPIQFLTLLGWKTIDPIASRLVAAALLAIGTESLVSRNSSLDSYKTMLTLKIIWSSVAIAALLLGLLNGGFDNVYIGVSILSIFVIFNIVWSYWYLKLIK